MSAITDPIAIIRSHFNGILAITKAKVTIAISSGIPCKINAINGISINKHPLF